MAKLRLINIFLPIYMLNGVCIFFEILKTSLILLSPSINNFQKKYFQKQEFADAYRYLKQRPQFKTIMFFVSLNLLLNQFEALSTF